MEPLTRERVEAAIFSAAHRAKSEFVKESGGLPFALATYRDGLISRQAMGHMVYELNQSGRTLAAIAERAGMITQRACDAYDAQFQGFKIEAIEAMKSTPIHVAGADDFLEDGAPMTLSAARSLIDQMTLAQPQMPRPSKKVEPAGEPIAARQTPAPFTREAVFEAFAGSEQSTSAVSRP